MQNVFGLTPPEPNERPVAPRAAAPARTASFDVARIAATFGRWFWEFAAVFALILLLGIGYIALLRDPAFVSEARLFVRVSQEQTPPQTIFAGNGVSFLANSSGDVVSEIDLFLNGDLVDKVIETANLEALVSAPRPVPEGTFARIKYELSETARSMRAALDKVLVRLRLKSELSLREALAEQIKQSIRVQNTSGSNVIVVGFEWGDRNVPQPLLQHYLDAFLDFRVDVFSTGEPAYFMDQRKEAEEELARLSGIRAQLRQESGFHATQTQRSQIVTLLEKERQDLARLQNEYQISQDRLKSMRAVPAGDVALANIPNHPLLTALDERSVALVSDAQGARAGPERTEILSKISALRETTDQTMQDYALGLTARIKGSENQIAELENRLNDMASFDSEWDAIQRRLGIAEKQYQFFADRVNELQSLADLRQQRIGNIVVLQQPSAPRLEQRVRNKSLLTAIGVFGLMAALAWVALREFLDDRVRTVDDVETLTGMTPLGILPRKAKGAQRRRAFSLAAAEVANDLRATKEAGGSAVLQYCAIASQPKDIEQDARELAHAFEENGFGKVRIFNLAGWPDRNSTARLGQTPIPVTSFFTETEANEQLNRCEEGQIDLHDPEFSLTLIITPPIEHSPIAMRVAHLSDAVLLTLTSGKDSRREVKRAVRRQVNTGVDVVGVIFSAARATLPRFLKADPV